MNFKKAISHFIPLRKYYKSEVSGTLEVAWVDGKKLLDTKNSNYSYGSAEKILDLGLEKVDVSSFSNVLVLGLGGGSVIHSLRQKFHYRGPVTAIENDPVVIELSKKEFGITENNTLRIVQYDAFKYINDWPEKYDLIVVDLFVDKYVCAECYSNDFWISVYENLSDKGSFIFNAGIDVKSDERMKKLLNFLPTYFATQIYHKAERLNTLIVGNKILI